MLVLVFVFGEDDSHSHYGGFHMCYTLGLYDYIYGVFAAPRDMIREMYKTNFMHMTRDPHIIFSTATKISHVNQNVEYKMQKI